jgi:hypothetical protein
MPFPKSAFTIQGGCNCEAIRYTVNVPEFAFRKQNPYRTPGTPPDGDLRIPMVAVDHYNDCRRATGAILPMDLVTDIYTVSTTCVSRTDSEKGRDFTADELYNFETVAKRDVFLSLYKSSEKRTRRFCGRCGTSLAYYGDPMAKSITYPTTLESIHT